MKLSYILLILIFICLIASYNHSIFEGFDDFWFASRDTCPTRNQSYDIRGDIPISRSDFPINNSEIGPQNPSECQNRPLHLGSPNWS